MSRRKRIVPMIFTKSLLTSSAKALADKESVLVVSLVDITSIMDGIEPPRAHFQKSLSPI